MALTATENAQHFLRRVKNLQNWFRSVLKVCELRDENGIRAAEDAYARWAADGRAGDVVGSLSYAWEAQVESAPGWADDPTSLAKELPLNDSPAWVLQEFFLVAGLVFTKAAETLGKGGRKDVLAAAMLYADAVDAQNAWLKMRGFANCRNPNTRQGEVEKAIEDAFKRQDIRQARKEMARKGGAARVAIDRDGTQAAKAGALELWKERHAGNHPKLRTVEQFATEVMRRWPVLKSSKVICGWSAKWTKEAKAGRTPAI